MKRALENDDGDDPSIPGDRDETARLDTALLTHMLSYGWRSTHALALTCRRFLAITRSRPYWRALAFRVLPTKGVPPNVLKSVDWFHGLEETDPAHYMLWKLIKDDNNELYARPSGTEGRFSIVFYAQEAYPDGRLPVFEVFWGINKPWKIQMCLHHFRSVSKREIEGLTSTVYINAKHLLYYLGQYEDGEDKVIHCALYNQDKTRVWCGIIAILDGDRWRPHEPFGHWVDAKDFVMPTMTWDLLCIRN